MRDDVDIKEKMLAKETQQKGVKSLLYLFLLLHTIGYSRETETTPEKTYV